MHGEYRSSKETIYETCALRRTAGVEFPEQYCSVQHARIGSGLLRTRYSVAIRLFSKPRKTQKLLWGKTMIAQAEELALAESMIEQHGLGAIAKAEELLFSTASVGNRDLASKWLRVVVMLEYSRTRTRPQ